MDKTLGGGPVPPEELFTTVEYYLGTSTDYAVTADHIKKIYKILVFDQEKAGKILHLPDFQSYKFFIEFLDID